MTQALQELLETLEAVDRQRRERAMDFFVPYPKQREHLNAGQRYKERLLMAGNQLGKSETGAYEMALHLTGEYPAGWQGKRWNRPIRAWAAGESSLLVRDVQQKKLCGPPGVDAELGTGMIPRAAFAGAPSLSRGVTDAYDTISVTHKTNGVVDGVSTLTFKSYEQGRKKFQGEPVDLVWLDEEPPADIYSECFTRTVAVGGIIYCTFTPLQGRTELVIKFMDEEAPTRKITTMTMGDAAHMTPEKRAEALSGYPKHEWEARSNGVPLLGSGRIFELPDEAIAEPPLEYMPAHWVKLWGIDFGIGHPFAAVLIAWDRDNDVVHVLHCIRMPDTLPIQHAAAMRPIGAAVPVAWPQDGTDREKSSGQPLSKLYAAHDLLMLPEPAMWPTGGNSTEAGIAEMDERERSGRLKVAAHLSEYFDERRMYHRKDGMIVKLRDDIMSATRVAIMAKRFARAVQLGSERARRRGRGDGQASDVDFDVFA